jgi:hypothetical protein
VLPALGDARASSGRLGLDPSDGQLRDARIFAKWAILQTGFWASFWDERYNPYVNRAELNLSRDDVSVNGVRGVYAGRNFAEVLFIDARRSLLGQWHLGQKVAQAYQAYCGRVDCAQIDLDIADVAIGLATVLAGNDQGHLYAARGLIGRSNLDQAGLDVYALQLLHEFDRYQQRESSLSEFYLEASNILLVAAPERAQLLVSVLQLYNDAVCEDSDRC